MCASIGVVVTLEMLIPDSDLSGQAMMFLFALSFIIFAIRSKKNWWAIIPGGIFASIGLVVMLEIVNPQQEFPILQSKLHWGVYSWVMFLGFAATFAITWLLRKSQPTAWTKYPAVGLLVIALMALTLGSRFQEIWMVSVLVAIGAMFVLGLLSRVHVPSRQQPPHLKA
jgi:Na+-transporting methylmalonyl-CoA/oxaloacetate decarboxylase beta subunit